MHWRLRLPLPTPGPPLRPSSFVNCRYKAHVIAVRRDPRSGELSYDVKYDGFDEAEAYDYGKPAEEVAAPEEFESEGEEEEPAEEPLVEIGVVPPPPPPPAPAKKK